MFSYTAVVDGEEHDIVLRPFGEMPGRISRIHRGDIEAQMWEAFEWGLKDSKQLAVIDDMPMREIMDMLQAWQEDGDTDMGKSPASTATRKASTRTRSKQT